MALVKTGLEVLLSEGVPEIASKRVGLVTNPTAIDRHYRSAIDLLHQSPTVDLQALFGPEHGVRGDAQAGVEIATSIDERTGLPAYSLYGNTKRPTAQMLQNLDALVFDMQDFGVRYATYLSTMLGVQEACAEHGRTFVVLDRPNPLGGAIEGSVLDPAFASFVGAAKLPVRHGMTLGELALMMASERGWPRPVVVPMHGWQRTMWFDQTGLPWVLPSPNAPTLDTLTVYAGTCLIEATNLSEGRGTTRPFEFVGAPWLDPYALADALDDMNLPGVTFRATTFTPMYQKHAHLTCSGVQVHVIDRDAFRPVTTGVHLLATVREHSGERFQWIEGPQGFFADLLLGTSITRIALDTGTAANEIVAGWHDDELAWSERRQPFLLYP